MLAPIRGLTVGLVVVVPLVAAALACGAPSSSAAAGCPAGGTPAPPGAATRVVGDLDGDGVADTLWLGKYPGAGGGTTRVVGVTTASGASSDKPVGSASPIPLTALAIDAQQNNGHQVIVSDGRSARLYVFADCRLQTVVDGHYGWPFIFDMENLRDSGTGVGCSDLGDGRHLVGLQALQDSGQWTVRRTEIDLDGTRASTGRSDTLTATSAQDPVVTTAQTISCGDVTINQDGVQQP